MNKSFLIIIFTLITFAMILTDAICQEVKPDGNTEIAYNNKKYKVLVTIKSLRERTPPSIKPYYEKKIVSVPELLNIAVNGNNIFVPRSVFTDLFEINKAVIKEDKKGFILIMYGADASESFEVRVYFDEKKVNRRTLTAGENETITQDTYYKLIID